MISKKSVDPRVKKLLDAMGLNYEVSADGVFEITFILENERKQSVSIDSRTEQFNDLEIRDIYSPAVIIPENELTIELAYGLLNENMQTKFGAWCADKSDGMVVIYYSAKVAADIDQDSLGSVLEMVMHQADRLEAMIHEDDTF